MSYLPEVLPEVAEMELVVGPMGHVVPVRNARSGRRR